MTLTLSALLLVAIAASVVLASMYANTRLKLARTTIERDKLKEALTVSRGYLLSVSTNSIPGVSEGATRTLDAVDHYLVENE